MTKGEHILLLLSTGARKRDELTSKVAVSPGQLRLEISRLRAEGHRILVETRPTRYTLLSQHHNSG